MNIRFVYHWNELYKSLFLMISDINKNILKLKSQILLKSIISMVNILLKFIIILYIYIISKIDIK